MVIHTVLFVRSEGRWESGLFIINNVGGVNLNKEVNRGKREFLEIVCSGIAVTQESPLRVWGGLCYGQGVRRGRVQAVSSLA